MNTLQRIKRTFFAISALLLLAVPTIATAEEAASSTDKGIVIALSPATNDISIAPGETKKDKITVINQGSQTFDFSTSITPYSVNGEEYDPSFSPIEGAEDVTKWLTIDSNDSGTLKPNDSSEVKYTLAVPAGTQAGSYSATFFAETKKSDSNSGGIVTTKRVGSIFLINVTGDVKQQGSVASWEVKNLQNAPLQANLRLSNEGGAYYRAETKIVVTDIFGNTKFKSDINPSVFPQKTRKVNVEWKDGATFGLFKVSGEVKIFDKTEKLPTKYVLVASTSMRIALAGIVILFLVSMVALIRGSFGRESKK